MAFNKIWTFRDLTLMEFEDEVLVMACDSLGGIGPKPNDSLPVAPEIVGAFTARVPLMEVLAAGARPTLVINTLAVEMEPTGAAIIAGIKGELEQAGLEGDLVVTGSTEENMKTCQTAVGITVLGRAPRDELRLATSRPGNLVLCLGTPQVGQEVLTGSPKAAPRLIMKLLQVPWLQEILPVGSTGIKHEARLLAEGVGAKLKLLPNPGLDLEKSAGPSTCLLVTVPSDRVASLQELVSIPVYPIGVLT